MSGHDVPEGDVATRDRAAVTPDMAADITAEITAEITADVTADITVEATASESRGGDPRILARRSQVTASRFRRRRRVLGSAVALLLVAISVPAFLRSRFVDLDTVIVVGSDSVDADGVAQMAGIEVGDALVSLDEAAIARRLRAQPRFSRVTVQIRFPATLEVRLTDRRPIARVAGPTLGVTAGEGGVVIDLAIGDEALPVVEVSIDPAVEPGAVLESATADAVDLLGSLSWGRKSEVERLVVGPGGVYSFRLTGDRTVLFGTIDQATEKLAAITTMLGRRVDTTGVCQLDVRVPALPKFRRVPDCAVPTAEPPPPAVIAPLPSSPPPTVAT